VLTRGQAIDVVELQREIEDWFAHEARLEMHISLTRSIPPIEETVAREIVGWARTHGYLAQCVSGRLLVKKPSRFHSNPTIVKFRGSDMGRRTA
jgi:hypothetical protein